MAYVQTPIVHATMNWKPLCDPTVQPRSGVGAVPIRAFRQLDPVLQCPECLELIHS